MTFLSCVDKDAGELKKEIKEIKTPLVRRFNSVSVLQSSRLKMSRYSLFRVYDKVRTIHMNKAEIKIVEEQINDCWQVASEIIEEFDMYGGGPEEEENRACEKLEKMQELFGDHNLPWQFKERLYLADYLVENCDGYYQDIGISKRKIKGKDY